MHRIGVVGISWRHAHADTLASFTISRDEREARLPQLAAELGVKELVYVATCNRVEVAFALSGNMSLGECRRRVFGALTGSKPQPGEAEHALRAWLGEGAAEHLFLVTAGLDSARVGESEITGQIRDAIEQSKELGLMGPHLDAVLDEALKVAKRVRPMTEGRIGKVSLAHIALRHVTARVQRTAGRVALVGVSPMTEQCARELAALGIGVVIVNRTLARAEALAAAIGGEARSLAAFRDSPDAVEAMVVATGSREPLFTRADLERLAARTPSGESPLVVDLCVPPNVAPEDAVASDVQRLGMAEITAEAAGDRERVLGEFADVRAIVDESLTGLRRQMAERLVGPTIAELRGRYRQTAIEGVERLFAKELQSLGESERETIRRWAETLARRFAHLPSVGLRDLAFKAGPAAVEAFLATVEPDMARELHEAAERSGVGLVVEAGLDES